MNKIDTVLSSNMIATDDKEVQLHKKVQVNILDYIGYLVSCMDSESNNSNDVIKDNKYYWAVYDDISNEFGGQYFKVVKSPTSVK